VAEENMGAKNRDERLEAMLDSMLRAYSDEQPRPGLETRVLATLRAQEGLRKSVWWNIRWTWSVGGVFAAAALLFAVWLWQAARLPAPPATVFNAPAPVPTMPSPEIQAIRQQDGIRRARPEEPVASADVRQEIFPSPTPLSEQEQALLRYLAGTSREEIIAQSRPDPPPPPPDDGETLQPQSQQLRRSEGYNTR
jgi:hypothetical protein